MVKIITDSASDIPQRLAETLDVTVIPARILFGREKYDDGVDLDKSEFYEKLKLHRYHPLTTQASPLAFYREIQRIEKMGEDILIITLPLAVSKFRESAEIAAKNISSVNYHIYDSTGVSMYQGLIVIQAARLARLGYSLKGIIDKLDAITPRTITYAVAATFDYLIRGGRVPLTKGKIGSLLGITPLLEVNDSKIEAIETPKGLEKGIEVMIELLKQRYNNEEPLIGSVMHVMNPTGASALANELIKNFNLVDMIHTKIGPTIGAHVGPGAIGLAISPAIPELVEQSEIIF
ncbi:MAG: DegV family protein [Candidatus Kariarchaeaceae archaeon]|jgi:DegV family protein with EDD domain